MSRRARRGGSEAGLSQETLIAATISAIAGLRRLLRRLSSIENPGIRRELRKLEELLAALSGQAGRTGRHRFPGDGDCETEIMPDPATARTAAELITVLWQYRAWRGNPTWRRMAASARQIVARSTIYNAMHGHALPTLGVVKAVIVGCGGSQDDVDAFTSAWHRISEAAEADGPGLLPAPVSPLHLVTII